MADLTTQLADQLDRHWQAQLRPRLDGLTDEKYFWRPVPDCWTVHRNGLNGAVDFSFPAPDPVPFTTIAWGWPTSSWACSPCATTTISVAHPPTIKVGTTPPTRPPRCASSTTATPAGSAGCGRCRPLTWPAGAARLKAHTPHSLSELVLHINREAIHHGPEIACLRDLHLHRQTVSKED